MSRHAIPEYVAGHEVDRSGRYLCPLCRAQTVSDEVDTGWVYCPMLAGVAICLGCCIDYQKAARSANFGHHPSRDLFDTASRLTGRGSSTLRQICLAHQETIVRTELDHASRTSADSEA